MVTLSILKYLELNGFGTIDKDLFWEKMGLGEDGIYITSLGGDQQRSVQMNEVFEIYSRARNDVVAYQQLQSIVTFINASYLPCALPAVPPVSNWAYDGVSFAPMSAISSSGIDQNSRVIFSVTGRVYYAGRHYQNPPANYSIIITESGQNLMSQNNELLYTEEVDIL